MALGNKKKESAEEKESAKMVDVILKIKSYYTFYSRETQTWFKLFRDKEASIPESDYIRLKENMYTPMADVSVPLVIKVGDDSQKSQFEKIASLEKNSDQLKAKLDKSEQKNKQDAAEIKQLKAQIARLKKQEEKAS